MERTTFEKRIQPILNNIGIIGAGVTCIAYIIIVVILVVGFKVETWLQTTTFACVNAGVGLIVCELLKYQGQVFAESIPENKAVLDKYYTRKARVKKARSKQQFWVVSIVKDVLFKGATLAFTSIGLVMIVIEGSKDYKLLLLALANLIMFICFGLLGLNKAYNYINNEHIPDVKAKLEWMDAHPSENVIESQEGDKHA